MFEEINEIISVAAVFKYGKLIPFRLFWQNRIYEVKKVNLSYSAWEGRSKVYYFAVSDAVNYFKLRFDTGSLEWTLLESYVA